MMLPVWKLSLSNFVPQLFLPAEWRLVFFVVLLGTYWEKDLAILQLSANYFSNRRDYVDISLTDGATRINFCALKLLFHFTLCRGRDSNLG